MIASTDALSVAAIAKAIGGPEKCIVLLEGESLLNDASSITLFNIFMLILGALGDQDVPSVWEVIPQILLDVLRLSAIGVAAGVAFAIATNWLLRWLRWRGAKAHIDTTVVLAIAYLSFYVTNYPAQVSLGCVRMQLRRGGRQEEAVCVPPRW